MGTADYKSIEELKLYKNLKIQNNLTDYIRLNPPALLLGPPVKKVNFLHALHFQALPKSSPGHALSKKATPPTVPRILIFHAGDKLM
jgi:hypothetical protein